MASWCILEASCSQLIPCSSRQTHLKHLRPTGESAPDLSRSEPLPDNTSAPEDQETQPIPNENPQTPIAKVQTPVRGPTSSSQHAENKDRCLWTTRTGVVVRPEILGLSCKERPNLVLLSFENLTGLIKFSFKQKNFDFLGSLNLKTETVTRRRSRTHREWITPRI